MASVELLSTGDYFSIWRNGKRKPGDNTIYGALLWGRREDASNQAVAGAVPIAYGPILEWSE